MKKGVLLAATLLSLSAFAGEGFYQNGQKLELQAPKHGISIMSDTGEVKQYTMPDGNQIGVTTRILVKFKTPIDVSLVEQKYGIRFVKKMRRVYVFETDTPERAIAVSNAIYEREKVVYAQPGLSTEIKQHNDEDITSPRSGDFVNGYRYFDPVFDTVNPNDRKNYWGVDNTGGFQALVTYTSEQYGTYFVQRDVEPGVDSNVLEAWEAGFTGKDVKIAVVDSGFDMSHPDLRFHETYSTYKNNRDVHHTTTEDYHGTSVAGVINAAAGNAYGVRGIAPDADLIAISGIFEATNATIQTEAYIESFYHADDSGADIINCSWGSTNYLSDASRDAIEDVIATGRDGKGMIIFFSAGNESRDSLITEATLPDVISVGSAEPTGARAVFSNYGNTLDIVAPDHFLSLDPVGTAGSSAEDTMFVSGTSFATPFAASVGALVLEANPDLTLAQFKEILYSTAKKVGSGEYTNGYANYLYTTGLVDDGFNNIYTKNVETGYGMVNAMAAVNAALALAPTPTPPTPPSPEPDLEPEIFYETIYETVYETVGTTADDITALASGWHLIGTGAEITDMSIFDDTTIIWYYEGGSWKQYSPLPEYAAEIEASGTLLTSLPALGGFWVYK